MDKYKAVEYLFDCRTDRPSCDDTVFWRETGMKEDEEEVDSRDTSGMMATDMMSSKENWKETKVGSRVIRRLATMQPIPSNRLCAQFPTFAAILSCSAPTYVDRILYPESFIRGI